jgi:hypothetical protein
MCHVCRNAIVRVTWAGVVSLTMMGLGIGAVGWLLTVFAVIPESTDINDGCVITIAGICHG